MNSRSRDSPQQHDDSHNHHDDSHHHHHHDDQDNYVQNPPSYGSINAPITRYTARRWDTYSSNATNATTETNEEEEARDRKIQNCVKVVFGLLFIGVLVCVFMAYQEGHGPGYGGYPPEWVE